MCIYLYIYKERDGNSQTILYLAPIYNMDICQIANLIYNISNLSL